jgi:phage-related protein
MGNGSDGLSGIEIRELDGNPMNGDVYVFFNKTRTAVKMVVWDRDGYVVYSKSRCRQYKGNTTGPYHPERLMIGLLQQVRC